MAYTSALSVMTALFEVTVGLWALSGPGRRDVVRPASVILFLLAIYQILEVLICAGSSVSAFLPQLAFINVTWLPPMGVLLATQLYSPVPRVARRYARAMLGLAAAFSGWIAFHPGFASDPVCQVVFARYSHPAAASHTARSTGLASWGFCCQCTAC